MGPATRFTQGFSDWYAAAILRGRVHCLDHGAIASRPSGAQDPRPPNLYGYAFALDRTPHGRRASRLPATRNVVVVAIDLVP